MGMLFLRDESEIYIHKEQWGKILNKCPLFLTNFSHESIHWVENGIWREEINDS